MRVPKKEGISRGREKKKSGKVRHHSVSLQRESRARDADLGMRGEFRARGANLGTSRPARRISGHISESSAGSESGTRLTGGVGRFLAHLCG